MLYYRFQQFNFKQKINNKIGSQEMSGSLLLKSKIIYILKNENKQIMNLVLANNSQSKDGKIIEEISENSNFKIFQNLQKINISSNSIIIKLEIKCYEQHNKVNIPLNQYQAILNRIQDLKKIEEDEDNQDSDNQNQNQSQQDNSQHQHPPRSYNQEDSSNNHHDQEHRGRGRPKGSKNKKTIIKETLQVKEIPIIELKTAMNGLMKRGKGRPKGSKNKIKDFNNPIKVEEGYDSMSYGKRGKGRPKGSKNKIKMSSLIMVNQDMQNQQNKRRGRPLGAKNRANSVESMSGQYQLSQEFLKVEVERPDENEIDELYCCVQCQQSRLKRKIFENQTNVQQNIDILKNVYEDLGLQNKLNLIITAIKLGDDQSLQQLLSIVHKVEYYYKSQWNVSKMIEKMRFQTKTKREFLSKTGKEGNIVLLHDDYKKHEIWWKQVTIERIIQNLPRDQDQAHLILQTLFKHNIELKYQIYSNLASIVRCGNYYVAQMILRDILVAKNQENTLNFTQEYYDLLVGSLHLINQLKKINLIHHNKGDNYCSPIHAAAISQNSDFLRKLLHIFTDILNLEDSINRKPIHYAALSMNSQNISILVQNGADLKSYDKKKMTPLMLACQYGLLYNVEYIIQKVRDPNYINFKSQEGYTALHYAILKNNKECIELLINDPYVDLWALTKDKGDLFHLLAGTGNIQILDLILKKQILPYRSYDKFKRTPTMIAIRNKNNDCLVKLLQNGCKVQKYDSSLNGLLHYAAAYGNIYAIYIIKNEVQQNKNKKGIYPWQIAICKGHLGAAKLLELYYQVDFHEDPLYLALSNIRGTEQYLQCIDYITEKMMRDIYYEQKNSGNGYMHVLCSLSEQQYIKQRKEETSLSIEEIRQEYEWIQNKLLNFFLERGLDGYKKNYNGQTPIKLCIQNNNLIGIEKLLTGKLTFDTQSSNGFTILHCLCSIGCKGLAELKFLQKKLKQASASELKSNIKKTDHNGFDYLLFFVKNFMENISIFFNKSIKKYQQIGIQKREKKHRYFNLEEQSQKNAFQEFVKYEQKFISIVELFLDLGCDINNQVHDKKNQLSQKYKLWGIAHFIMKFPSIKILKFLKSRLKDFNVQNNQLMTPLHIFCQQIKKGNLLNTKYCLPDDYQSQKILQYLLGTLGMNPNIYDINRSLPLLYAAINHQYQFINILHRFKSQLNFCNVKNEIPFIEIIKKIRHFTIEQIECLLLLGMNPNFTDTDKRHSLHHLVFYSNNINFNPEICRLLIEYGAKINALDKYQRSPVFYCFCDIQGKASSESIDKVQILQLLINHKDINLNLFDMNKRTILHYACVKNHFFSILYLLDKTINIEAKDFQQNTPLAISLKNRNLDQAALIISKGVRYGFVEENGQKLTYFIYAYKNLSAGICFMLLDHGYPVQKALEEIPNSTFKQSLVQKYILR